MEAVTAGSRRVDKVWMDEATHNQDVYKVDKECKNRKIPSHWVPTAKIKSVPGYRHHAVVAFLAAKAYASLEELLDRAEQRKPATIVILDAVEDPGNLGAILRSGWALRAPSLILTPDKSVGLTPTVARCACGALEHVDICRPPNMDAAFALLKSRNFQCVGLDSSAEKTISDIKFIGNIALVAGSEGEGLRPHIRRQCNVLARIPQEASAGSLNVSVATGIALYEVWRQRG
jgi:23S rRNA (guanosine2251-2'-O)-methyltransferase